MIVLRGRYVRQRKLYRNDVVLHLRYSVVKLRIKPQSNPQLEIQIRAAKPVVFYTSEQQFLRANVHA